MIDILKLYQDFNIQNATSGKHVQKGWVGTPCPFCSGHFGYHLGYCIDPTSKFAGRFTCWRCGKKDTQRAIAGILSVKEREAKRILKRYHLRKYPITQFDPRKKVERKSKCVLPEGTGPLKKRHIQFLEKRGFKNRLSFSLWDLHGTGPVGGYRHRIIAPIYFRGELVSYQGRDITGKSELKYKACAEVNEVRPHKECLYGYDEVKGDSIVVVEGITDVWRLGKGAVATFGIKYTQAQVLLLMSFKNIFILYDTDPEAVEQAEKLSIAVTAPERSVEIIELDEGDPAELSQDDADYLMRDLKIR